MINRDELLKIICNHPIELRDVMLGSCVMTERLTQWSSEDLTDKILSKIEDKPNAPR
jgi:hypothetical protein